jgi:hypothetical protein
MIRPFPASNWDEVGLYDVKLNVFLDYIPSVYSVIAFQIRVLYPCGDLNDNYPNTFWLPKPVSEVIVYIGG